MIGYEVIKKDEIEFLDRDNQNSRVRWIPLLDSLAPHQALRINCESVEELGKKRRTLQGCARKGRRNYKIRTVKVGTVLYLWKEY